jgi:hypothetical protein
MMLVRVPDAAKTFDGMKARGVLVKNVSKMHPLLANCLRLTVGTADENAQMLAALEGQLCSRSGRELGLLSPTEYLPIYMTPSTGPRMPKSPAKPPRRRSPSRSTWTAPARPACPPASVFLTTCWTRSPAMA